MVSARELLLEMRLNGETLDAWIETGWLRPEWVAGLPQFTDIDLARAQFIRELREDFGINDEGIDLVLDLVDQIHGLRRRLREILPLIREQAGEGDEGAGRHNTR
jgi:chaperone modulatory protein CbpM